MATQDGTYLHPFILDPDERFDYKADFADALEDGEIIAEKTVTPSNGLTMEDDTLTDSAMSITFWIEPGDSVGRYSVNVHAVTSAGREFDRTIHFQVLNR